MSKLPVTFPELEMGDAADERVVLDAIRQMFTRIAAVFNNPDFGTTAQRPTSQRTAGQFYFDTTLDKPIWWKASSSTWVDATGTNV